MSQNTKKIKQLIKEIGDILDHFSSRLQIKEILLLIEHEGEITTYGQFKDLENLENFLKKDDDDLPNGVAKHYDDTHKFLVFIPEIQDSKRVYNILLSFLVIFEIVDYARIKDNVLDEEFYRILELCKHLIRKK